MAAPLPHSQVLRKDANDYVADAQSLLSDSVLEVGKDSSFINLYKATLGACAVVESLHQVECPSFFHASAILQRIPVHVLSSQLASARIDLRRLIELFFLTVYFSDHPVEWDALVRNPERSLHHEKENPIQANAHREPAYYRTYAKERFADEASKLGQLAVADLAGAYASLSESAHAPSATNSLVIRPPVQTLKSTEINEFAILFRRISSSVCLAASAFFSDRFDVLPATHRAWFDWLVGSERAKRVRSGKFGIPVLVSE